jgi:hypothetical protein
MRRFQWNALGVGDRVSVHEGPGPGLTTGAVDTVEVRATTNGVGIRTADAGVGWQVLWPARMAVHLEPRDIAERCWRCEAV